MYVRHIKDILNDVDNSNLVIKVNLNPSRQVSKIWKFRKFLKKSGDLWGPYKSKMWKFRKIMENSEKNQGTQGYPLRPFFGPLNVKEIQTCLPRRGAWPPSLPSRGTRSPSLPSRGAQPPNLPSQSARHPSLVPNLRWPSYFRNFQIFNFWGHLRDPRDLKWL